MKVLFDTSVLVAAMTGKHPFHDASLAWVSRAAAHKLAGFVSTHTLAELYGVLTGYPKWRISPESCLESLEVLKSYLSIVPLSGADYNWTLKRMAQLGLSGGAIYDALHARAALKQKVDALVTLNEKHFLRLGEDVAQLVVRPD